MIPKTQMILLFSNFTPGRDSGKDELNQLYLNKLAVGGFADGCYWSSSELDIYRAWTKHFGNGYQGSEYKVNYGRVRAVRSF